MWRDAELVAKLHVPLQRLQIHEQGARRVGHIRQVQRAVQVLRAAGEVPDQPGVDRARKQLAVLRALASVWHVVQDPRPLRGRRIRVVEQARLAQILRGVAVVVRAGVLPYDGVVDRLAVFFSQITAVSRWLVKPSASMSCSLMSSSASASLKARRVLRQISIGSCSTQPFCGMCWACSNCDWATTLPSVRVMHTRVDVVPWSIAAIKAMRAILRVCLLYTSPSPRDS